MKIKKAMDERIEELNQLVKRACSIISSVTGYTSVVLTPQFSKAEIKSVQFVVVDEKRLLVVVVAVMGIVNNKLIKHDTILDDNSIAQLTNVLNTRISGRTIDEVTMPMIMEIQTLTGLPATFVFLVIEAVQECVRRIESTDVYLDGITNLLNYPEFSDLLKAREVLELLNEEDVICRFGEKQPEEEPKA
jgi:heat-inducible transcriptional repressor